VQSKLNRLRTTETKERESQDKNGRNRLEAWIKWIECLPTECKALSSNPSNTHKKINIKMDKTKLGL
jgi:hypothetical protein